MTIALSSTIPEILREQSGITRDSQEDAPLLVHLWSSNCELSRSSMLNVERLLQGFSSTKSGPRFIGVLVPQAARQQAASDEDEDAIREWSKRFAPPSRLVFDEARNIQAALDFRCVPALFLFDGQLRLRHVQTGNQGWALLEQRVQGLLNKRSGER